ncbi:MAG: nickel-dependent lactate racemase [Spirochaetaceae bacterium]|nr:MAG: nickel-dependent lactate racemase [Spirochaetaceae bacterium]
MSGIEIEYGSEKLTIDLPQTCDVRSMGSSNPLPDPGGAIRRSFVAPIDSLPLSEMARTKLKRDPKSTVVVVVSDNTRPVPYRGPGGILIPLLETLLTAGYSRDRITILIGTGSHRPMSDKEIEAMLGLREAGYDLNVVNHDYEKQEDLVFVGQTRRGSPVWINRLYVEADLKIVTGLVESHFMAGASGGRKSICPAIASKETLRIFHGPVILESPAAADLVLEGNPCSEEAEQAAELTGCDFSVNVTLDSDKRITGVYSGDIFTSHLEAVKKIREYVTVQLDKRYDLVVIPGGFVSINHYQAAKAAIQASRALTPGGMIVEITRHSDTDPIGSEDYKKTLALLKLIGMKQFLETIKSKEWIFTHDQWETQMWCKVLEVIGKEENLIYCNLEIPDKAYSLLPGVPGLRYLSNTERNSGRSAEELMSMMAERAIDAAVESLKARLGRDPQLLLLPDGPYGVPFVRS